MLSRFSPSSKLRDVRYAVRLLRKSHGIHRKRHDDPRARLGATMTIFAVVDYGAASAVAAPPPDSCVSVFTTPIPKAGDPETDGCSLKNYYERRGPDRAFAGVAADRDGRHRRRAGYRADRVSRVSTDFVSTIGSGRCWDGPYRRRETLPTDDVAISRMAIGGSGFGTPIPGVGYFDSNERGRQRGRRPPAPQFSFSRRGRASMFRSRRIPTSARRGSGIRGNAHMGQRVRGRRDGRRSAVADRCAQRRARAGQPRSAT